MPFDLARYNVPNIAAIIAMALMPLVALPMLREQGGSAKANALVAEEAVRHAAAATAIHDIAD